MTSLKDVHNSTPVPQRRGTTPGWMDRRKARLQAEAEAAAREAAVEVLPGAAPFNGGLCVGRWSTFDPPAPRETRQATRDRWGAARRLCAECPVLARCRDWYDGLPEEQRPGGVVAGAVRTSFAGRKPKEAA